jgi:hypothetical protein
MFLDHIFQASAGVNFSILPESLFGIVLSLIDHMIRFDRVNPGVETSLMSINLML